MMIYMSIVDTGERKCCKEVEEEEVKGKKFISD